MAELLAIAMLVAGVVLFGRKPPKASGGGAELPFRPDATDEEIADGGRADTEGDDELVDDSSVGPDWPYPTIDLGEVANTPTPGFWYRVRPGDTLLNVAGTLRSKTGSPPGSRVEVARLISRFNWQKRTPPASEFERGAFPDGLVRLLPRYKRNPATPQETDEPGPALPLLYMPEAGETPPPIP